VVQVNVYLSDEEVAEIVTLTGGAKSNITAWVQESAREKLRSLRTSKMSHIKTASPDLASR